MAQYLDGPQQQLRAYSPAVVTEGGRIVWMAGQIATVDGDGKDISGNFEAQTHRVFALMDQTLQRVGGTLANLVTMTVFIKEPRYGDRFVEIRKDKFADGHYPASALITVTNFARPGIEIEIQGIAVIGDRACTQSHIGRFRDKLAATSFAEELKTMSVSIRQIHPVFVGEVSGIDITRALSRDEVAAVEAGMDRYAVLLFRDQKVTDEQQMAFSLNFGVLEDARGGNITKPEDRRLPVGMGDVSNLGRDGQPMDRASRQRLFNLGNMLWHSDSSFRAIPAKYSLLSARVVNPVGGNTEFADMRAAYDALDTATKAEIEDLVCEHSLMYSRGSLGLLDYSDEERAMFRPVRQRLVRTHPVTGRKSLYLSSHAGAIVGMPMAEARILLRDLTEHATQPRFVYAHTWRPWDLIIWDNRQMMHRVRRYDESQPRDMRRTTIAGEAPTVAQVEAA